jgi:hypothetical protein
MIQVRDTFLHYLADNLPSLKVHPIRSDPNDPASAVFEMNAVSVTFGNMDFGVLTSIQHVSIDICYDTESAAVATMQSVWTALGAAFFCPLLDYTDTAAPVPVGTNNIYWDRLGVKFRRVRSDYYCHYTCSLKLTAHLG